MKTVIPAKAGIQFCVVFAAMTAFVATAQTMYKWVDEKGITHYTDAPPPDGKGQKIDIRATPPSAPVQPPPSFQEKEQAQRGQQLQKDQAKKAVDADQAKAQAYKRGRCIEARRQLGVLALQRPLFTFNDKGEKVYMEDKDRQAQVDRWQGQVDEFCSGE
ncbi:MAG TPA: DUF4124 domain-containing protein [Usitatibacter sp.]|nr:DUF4124 domain-containing protein [Usitatibacter sp.]